MRAKILTIIISVLIAVSLAYSQYDPCASLSSPTAIDGCCAQNPDAPSCAGNVGGGSNGGGSTCPTIPSNQSFNSTWPHPIGWAQSSSVTVYIVNTGFSNTDITDIETAFQNWQSSASSSTKVTFLYSVVSSVASTPAGNYVIVSRGTNTNGYSANTTLYPSSNFASLQYATMVFLSSVPDSSLEMLATHEIGHTFFLGDCTDPSCAGTSVSYEDGNTLTSPSQCDDQATTTYSAMEYSAQAGSGSGGGSGGGTGGPYQCSGLPPNSSCWCDTNTGEWVCDCSGQPYLCSDGTESECDGGFWSCPTVSVGCDGKSIPYCGEGGTAVCNGTNYQCYGGPCDGEVAYGSGCSCVEDGYGGGYWQCY